MKDRRETNKAGAQLSEIIEQVVRGKVSGPIADAINQGDFSSSITLILKRIAMARHLTPEQENQLLHDPVLRAKLTELLNNIMQEAKEVKQRNQRIEELLEEMELSIEQLLQSDTAFQKQQAEKRAEFIAKKKQAEELLQKQEQASQHLATEYETLETLKQEYEARVQQFVAVIQQGAVIMEEVGLGLRNMLPEEMTQLLLDPGALVEQLRLFNAEEIADTVQEKMETGGFVEKLEAVRLLDHAKALTPDEQSADQMQEWYAQVQADIEATIRRSRENESALKFTQWLQEAEQVQQKLQKAQEKCINQIKVVEACLNDVKYYGGELKEQENVIRQTVEDSRMIQQDYQGLTFKAPNASLQGASPANASSTLFSTPKPMPKPSAPSRADVEQWELEQAERRAQASKPDDRPPAYNPQGRLEPDASSSELPPQSNADQPSSRKNK